MKVYSMECSSLNLSKKFVKFSSKVFIKNIVNNFHIDSNFF